MFNLPVGKRADTGFYNGAITKSIWLDGSADYLNRTQGAGNSKIFTVHIPFKRTKLGAVQTLMEAGTSFIKIDASDKLDINITTSGTNVDLVTTRVFRDIGQWYLLTFAMDTGQGTANNRNRVYLGTAEITAFDTRINASSAATLTDFNANTVVLYIGANGGVSEFWDGLFSTIYWVDGTQGTGSTFCQSKRGIDIPITIGSDASTNSFKLDWTSSGDLGNDRWNANDFTLNSIAAANQIEDNPENNFCTLTDLDVKTGDTVSIAGCKLVSSGSDEGLARSTFAFDSGKWYIEGTIEGTITHMMGIAPTKADIHHTSAPTSTSGSYNYYAADGNKYKDTTGAAYGSGRSATDVIGMAVDFDNQKIWWRENGTWVSSGDPAAGTNAAYTDLVAGEFYQFIFGDNSNAAAITWTSINFGQDTTAAGSNADENGYGSFVGSVPSGFLAPCSANLPTVGYFETDEEEATAHFITKLYEGTAAELAIATGHNTDVALIKNRDATDEWEMVDAIRGATLEWNTDSNSAESTVAQGLKSFDDPGVTLGTDANGYNASGESHVLYSWVLGTAVSGTTNGSKAYSGQVNTKLGMSCIKYKANGSAGHEIPHHLGVTPELVIIKARTAGLGGIVTHDNLTGFGTYFLALDTTAAETANTHHFNNAAPTSTVVALGGASSSTNDIDNNDFIMYCFASTDLCHVFSYVGNGNADGTFIWIPFRPASFILKEIDSTSNWMLIDSARSTYNVTSPPYIHMDTTDVEATHATRGFDILSNGIKIRNASNALNTDAETGIGVAFAEHPFKFGNAR